MPDDPFPPFETARLLLRCVAPDDAAATSALMTPEVSRWLASWPLPFTPAMATARIESLRLRAVERSAMPLAVVEKASAALAGWVVIERDGETGKRGAVGYWLGEAYQRRGYMREAMAAALPTAFARLDLEVIEAGAQLANVGSFAIMRACGMRPAGQRMVYAPTRGREELCQFYEIERQHHVPRVPASPP